MMQSDNVFREDVLFVPPIQPAQKPNILPTIAKAPADWSLLQIV